VTGKTVIAIDSDRMVAWTGGPQNWANKPASYFKDPQISDQTLVIVTPDNHKHLHVYKVSCLAKGDSKITLTVGNKPSMVSTTKKGLVSTGTHTGSAVIIAKYTDGNRVEEVAVMVEVRPMQFLLARSAGDQWTGMELKNLPNG